MLASRPNLAYLDLQVQLAIKLSEHNDLLYGVGFWTLEYPAESPLDAGPDDDLEMEDEDGAIADMLPVNGKLAKVTIKQAQLHAMCDEIRAQRMRRGEFDDADEDDWGLR
jgi:hypothetical protein